MAFGKANARGPRAKGGRRRKRRVYHRRKVCRFCADSSLEINYKAVKTLKHFITERGKIIPGGGFPAPAPNISAS